MLTLLHFRSELKPLLKYASVLAMIITLSLNQMILIDAVNLPNMDITKLLDIRSKND